MGDGEAATSAELDQPSAIALDSAGNLFIADPGTQRIRQVGVNGTMITLAGTGVAAHADVDGPAATAPLYSPMGVALDAVGDVLVADTYNHRIVKITPARTMSTVAGTGKSGIGADNIPPLLGQLNGPRAVCLDRGGVLYIVDTNNHRVLRLPQRGTLQTVAGNASQGFSGDGTAARFAQLNAPSACAFDSFGSLFIADTGNHCIRKVSAAGVISTVSGNGVAGFSGDEGPAAGAHFALRAASPSMTTAIFIADTGNNRIRDDDSGRHHPPSPKRRPGRFAGDGAAATALLDGRPVCFSMVRAPSTLPQQQQPDPPADASGGPPRSA